MYTNKQNTEVNMGTVVPQSIVQLSKSPPRVQLLCSAVHTWQGSPWLVVSWFRFLLWCSTSALQTHSALQPPIEHKDTQHRWIWAPGWAAYNKAIGDHNINMSVCVHVCVCVHVHACACRLPVLQCKLCHWNSACAVHCRVLTHCPTATIRSNCNLEPNNNTNKAMKHCKPIQQHTHTIKCYH